MRRTLVRLVIITALLGVGVAAIYARWVRTSDPSANLLTTVVTRGTVEDAVTAVGAVQPLETVDIGAQVSGTLKALYVDEGDAVKRGQLVAEIDDAVYAARVAQDQANLDRATAEAAQQQAALDLARAKFNRAQQLAAKGLVSRDDAETVASAYKQAQANVDAAVAAERQTRAALAADRTNLGFTKIYAPIAGTVIAVKTQQGQTVNANQQAPVIVQLASLSTMIVRAQVSEADIPTLHPGMTAYFTTLGQPERRWTGTLREVLPAPELVNGVVLYIALVDVPNPNGELKVQMTAQVFFVRARAADVPLVPVAALQAADARAHAGPPKDGIPSTAGKERDTGTGSDPRRGSGVRAGSSAGATSGSRQDVQAEAGAKSAGGRQDVPAPTTQYSVRVVENGAIVTRTVRVGVRDRLAAEVISGLELGDRVVVGTAQADGPKAAGAGQGQGKGRGGL